MSDMPGPVLAERCPRCKAEPGEPCRMGRRYRDKAYHLGRADRAIWRHMRRDDDEGKR